jgi:hypothetical protein
MQAYKIISSGILYLGLLCGMCAGNDPIGSSLIENRLPPKGKIDPNCTIQSICAPKYTQTVRPPVSYTDALKIKQIAERCYVDTDPRHYEEDHFIPLELCGHPTDPDNLWPQSHLWPFAAVQKDWVENALHKAVCEGNMDLPTAQRWIVQWEIYYETNHR